MRFVVGLIAALAVIVPAGVRADSAPPAPAIPLSYDDPGMHFSPPAGWERLSPESASKESPVVAVYAKNRGQREQQIITVRFESFSGSLDGFQSSHEIDLRNTSDSTFVDRKERTTLQNGMPAWWMKVSQGDQPGQMLRRYEWVVFDGVRGIVVGLTAGLGVVGEDEAKAALKDLSVVVYPSGR